MTQENKVYTLDIPQEDGEQGFTGTYFGLVLKLAEIIRAPDLSKNPMNVYIMTNLLISLIPNDEINGKPIKYREDIRQELKERRKVLHAEYKKEHNLKDDAILSQSQADLILVLASIECIGYVTDFFDKTVGLSTKNKIGFCRKNSNFEPTSRNII